MKKQAHSILIIAVLLATVSISVAAQSDRLIVANVPFNFVTKDKALPAGEYVFELVQLGGSDAVKIQSADGHITVYVPTRSAKAKVSQAEAKLVFNRYADQYFLSQVCGLEDSTTQQLAKPRAEDRLAKTEAEKKNVSIAAHKR
ncbi:MAG TPA: hypothetical protein VNO24_13005 [Blastocatellia bacterium]|nr:hypothetical protein [Blastocatellia bacterium]